MKQQREQQKEQLEILVAAFKGTGVNQPVIIAPASIPSCPAFDTTLELFTDYWTRFTAFVGAHS